ncbi:DUF4332 domain-containing protein [Legionella israelensis]|uniref:DUF4332 domain-containing protein n=1 Tax=Legionella israelensis TaxID=454 RepID=A0AAX1EDM8_9GAMM|nr:DUF4332 domain-containing protein [Legionella israelensis]QBR82959.1 DUF4332 domain-containing protein [Legionella israelensis]
MRKLNQIENISVKHASLMENAGIEDQEELLKICSDRKARQQIAEQTGIHVKLILKWTSQADLSRIKGIGDEFAELLVSTGIESAAALAKSDAEHLLEELKLANQKIRLVKHMPSLNQLETWIEQAKTLPEIVSY